MTRIEETQDLTKEQKIQQLFQYLYKDNSLSIFIKHCSKVLGHPIWLMDEAFNLLEASSDAFLIWENEFQHGAAMDELITEWNHDTTFHQMNEDREAKLHICSRVSGETAVSNIYVNQERVAKFTAFYIQKEELSLVDDICNAISIMVQKLNYLPTHEGYETQLLHRLLQEELTELELNNYIARGHLNYYRRLPLKMACICNDSGKDMGTMEYCLKSLRQIFTHAVMICHKGNYVLLIKRPFTEQELNRGRELFEKYNLYCGMSNEFHDIRELKAYYEQASYASEQAAMAKGDCILDYEEVYVRHLFSMVGDRMNLRAMCSPKLIAIMEYDKEHQTQYYKTLKAVYLESNSREEAAQRLNVHVNTIKYRLQQVEEIFGYRAYTPKEQRTLWLTTEIIASSELIS